MPSAETWADVTRESLVVGEVLRVKLNAYSTDAGTFHNGRLVEVIEINGGDVVVRTIDDREPVINHARHSPYKLQRRQEQR